MRVREENREASGLDLAVHVYPAWSKASYTCEVLAELARLPWVKVFKVGTREMNKYARDIEAIRKANPEAAVLTCHDEYLLASIAVVVIGGTSVAGGKANVPGVWGAALFLVLLLTMLNTFGVSAGVRLMLTGLIIVGVITAAGDQKAPR